jgi:hypothetical protein
MQWGEVLTRSLAAMAVACYLLRVLLDAWGSRSPRIARWKRSIWTLGCVALWLHIATAFHFIHDWSHPDAVRQTAEQTETLTGRAFGGGIYFNYAFAGLWLWDLIRWWRRGSDEGSTSTTGFWTMHGVFAFMMVNATVVFGPVYWRYVGLISAGLLIAVWAIQRRSRDNM